MTVGEANGVKLEDADKWVSEEHGYFDMIFQFEFLGLWQKDGDGTVNVQALKENLSKWQAGLEGKGWNALFIENHDQPRRVSTWGNDRELWKESAKMLAALYFLMKGTPFIYQGQEIGMTNVQFPSIEDYNDVGMINYYKLETEKGRPHEDIMQVIWKQGRDNSRTPMQWHAGAMAGFTTSNKTWMKLNPNYVDINVSDQMNDPDSILNFYKALIKLRKENEVFVYGSYKLLLADHPSLFVYTRTFGENKALVINNFSEKHTECKLPAEVSIISSQPVLHNYEVEEEKLVEKNDIKALRNKGIFI